MSLEQARRQVLMHPAGPEIRRVEPRARHPLVEAEQHLALLEQPQHRRAGPDIHRVAGGVQDMVEDARDLREHHADILRALGNLDVRQLLDGQHIAVLHAHRRHVIEAVHVRQRLEVGLRLAQLFRAAVEQADVRIAPLDDLAVELHDQPQHAVRRGVLRPEVDHVVGRAVLGRVVVDQRRDGRRLRFHARTGHAGEAIGEDGLFNHDRSPKIRCHPRGGGGPSPEAAGDGPPPARG